MRNVVICAGVVVISGVMSATMWNALRTERKLTADLQTKLTDVSGRIQTLTLAAQRNNLQQAPAAASTAASGAKVESPAPDRIAQAATFFTTAQNSQALLDSRAREKELMADPEYRKARLAQQRLNTERNYPGLAEELGLSQKEADRLLDLITENQMNRSNELTLILGAGGVRPDTAAMAELQQKQQAMEREQEQQLAALLGAGKYGKWQEYQQSRGGRQQAMSLGTQLAQVGLPLSDVQQRGLTTAMIAEQKRMQSRIEPLVRSMSQLDPQARLQLQDQAMQLEAESNSNMLTAAAAHLTERQIAVLRQQFESQAAMSAAQRRLNQNRQQPQGISPAP